MRKKKRNENVYNCVYFPFMFNVQKKNFDIAKL